MQSFYVLQSDIIVQYCLQVPADHMTSAESAWCGVLDRKILSEMTVSHKTVRLLDEIRNFSWTSQGISVLTAFSFKTLSRLTLPCAARGSLHGRQIVAIVLL